MDEDSRQKYFIAIHNHLNTVNTEYVFAFDWNNTLTAKNMWTDMFFTWNNVERRLILTDDSRSDLNKCISRLHREKRVNINLGYRAYNERTNAAEKDLQSVLSRLIKGQLQDQQLVVSQLCCSLDLDDPSTEGLSLKDQAISRVNAFIGLMSTERSGSDIQFINELVTHRVFQEYFPSTTQKSIGEILKALEHKPNIKMAIVSHSPIPKLMLACLQVVALSQGVHWETIKDQVICDAFSATHYWAAASKYARFSYLRSQLGQNINIFYADDSRAIEYMKIDYQKKEGGQVSQFRMPEQIMSMDDWDSYLNSDIAKSTNVNSQAQRLKSLDQDSSETNTQLKPRSLSGDEEYFDRETPLVDSRASVFDAWKRLEGEKFKSFIQTRCNNQLLSIWDRIVLFFLREFRLAFISKSPEIQTNSRNQLGSDAVADDSALPLNGDGQGVEDNLGVDNGTTNKKTASG